jgi:hypothetical protein
MIVYYIFLFIIIFAGFLARQKQSILIVFLVAFFFIGLRVETGFDWIIYKYVFNHFVSVFSWENIALIQKKYSQETGFLLLIGIITQIIPNYEAIQVLLTLFFLYSFFKLSSAIPRSRPALALAVFLSLFLLSVGFSTVRQALAMSLFNVGLYHFLRGKSPLYIYSFFLAAIAIHVSATAYILIFLAARVYQLLNGKLGVVSYILFSGILLFTMPLIFLSVVSIFPAILNRVDYYQGITITDNITRFSMVFSAVIFLTGFAAATTHQKVTEANDKLIVFRNMTVIFAAVTFASIFFLTLRDRLAYELLVLYSIFASSNLSVRNLFSICVVIVFGLYYQFSILQPPRDLAFIPYQNLLILFVTGDESTGFERSSQYIDIFNEQLAK